MFTDSPFEIEASDIDTLVRAGDAVTLPDGRVALPVLLVLSSASGKTFTADEFPTAMHLTNGVQVRRLVFEHLGAVAVEAHAEPAVAPAAEAVNTGTEATVEINPAPATTSTATAPAAPEPEAAPEAEAASAIDVAPADETASAVDASAEA